LIHQELNLFPNLSIAENLFLTSFPLKLGRIDQAAIRRRSAELLEQVGLDISPDAPVEKLSAGQCQLVEVAKALNLNPQLIILDEPTTSLSSRESERLFEMLRKFRQQGVSMIYISHALGDVLRLCDEIVVLRDGEVVGNGPREQFTTDRMISLMVGREIEQLFPPRRDYVQAEPVLVARGVTQPAVVQDVSLSVGRGEVLGISGLMGSGRTELARILFGLDPMEGGEILLEGKRIEHLTPRQRIQQGMAMLTESRREDGLCMEASIAENIMLVAAPQFATNPVGWINSKRMQTATQEIRQSVRLTPSARDDQPVKTLSGGNQQKVVLAKWLLRQPKLLILDEPTRGIDVGAKYEIYCLIQQLAQRDAGVLVISSEIEELVGLCDRILVMNQGQIRDEIHCDAFDRQRILRASLHDGHVPGSQV
jgi:ribose transport system ATP-binding protein